MSKPALGRGLASLLQEETDRGDVKAPGLASWKGAGSSVPASPEASTTATSAPSDPASPVASDALSPSVPVVAPEAAPMSPSEPSETKPVVETPAPAPKPVAMASSVAPSAAPASAPVPPHAGGPAVPAVVPQPAPMAPTTPTVPAWIVPALIAGDVLVVVSGILWASWGRGWGRWPWIAALFAVGCSQALAALFLSRAGSSSPGTPFPGRPHRTGASGPAPGIRVRFVEEQPQSRRGDRR